MSCNFSFQILKNPKRLMLPSMDLMGFEARWYFVIYYVHIFFILNLEMLFRRY